MNIHIPQNKESAIKFAVIFFIILMCILITAKLINDNDKSKIIEDQRKSLFNSLNKNNKVNVTKYFVYGTHFNIEGTLDIIKISGIKISYVDLILKSQTGDEIRNKINF